MSLNFFQRGSIKARVTLFTLVILLISIWSLAFYASRVLREDMQHLLSDQQLSTVSFVAAEVNEELGSRMRALGNAAGSISPSMLGNTAALQDFLEQRQILQVLFNAGIFVTRIDGTATADVPLSAGRGGVNYMDSESTAAALKEGKSTIGRPVIGKMLHAPMIPMAAPIRDPQGKVIGALAGMTNLNEPNFLDKITANRYGKTGGYLLIAPQYRLVVTATDRSRIMEALPAPGISPPIDRFIQGHEGSAVFVNSLGEEILASDKGVPVAGWIMSAVLPTAEAFAPIRAMQQRMLLATLFLTLLAGTLTWWVLRRQLSPLLDAVEKLAAISEADQPLQTLPVTSQDEIGQLIGGFNRLLETLGQREATLRESQENLVITLNSIGDAVIATDSAGRVTRMNPVAERLSGWTLAECIGHPLSEVFRIIEADTRAPVTDPAQWVMTHGQVSGLASHTLLLARDGQEYRVADSAAPIRNVAGEAVGVVLVFSDISEKYRVEEALRNSEERMRSFFENVPVGVFISTSAGKLLYVNPALPVILGYDSREELMAVVNRTSITETLSAESSGHQVIDEEHAHHHWQTVEKRYRCKDGQIIDVILSIGEKYDSVSGETQFFSIITDISERKKLEAAREEALGRLQKIASRLPGVVFQFRLRPDGSSCFPYASESLIQLFRISPDEVRDNAAPIFGVIHPDDLAELLASIETSAKNLTPWHQEYRLKFEGEPDIWLLGNAIPQREADGSVLWHGFVTDITERKAAADRITHLAHHDALTGLLNRVSLMERLKQVLATAQREHRPLSVMFIDMDRFKTINDTLGHATGDGVLEEVARRLGEAVRNSDIVARLGGDEFVVVLTEVEDAPAVARVAEKILKSLGQTYLIDKHETHSTPSIGLAFFPSDGEDSETLLKNADTAMYHAKSQGRNNVQFFTPEMNSFAMRRLGLEHDMRVALEAGQFELQYQPKLEGRTGRVVGVEALLRWRKPDEGLVAPANFIQVAEETGLILPLGEWVLDEACRQLRDWRIRGLSNINMAVNLSALQLRSPVLLPFVAMTLEKHGLTGADLELEITESAVMVDPKTCIGKLKALRDMGVGLSIDDFGTGYSSLSYLKLMPIQTLKVDQSFVHDIETDANNVAICAATIALAHNMGLSVVAEGVETEAQRDFLIRHRCDFLQGFLFSKPVGAEAALAFFNGRKH